MSHQQPGHTETGPLFEVLSERREKQGINLLIDPEESTFFVTLGK